MALYRECSHPPAGIVYLNDTLYYASDQNGITEFEGDLVINLAGVPNIHNLDKYPELSDFIKYPFQINSVTSLISSPSASHE